MESSVKHCIINASNGAGWYPKGTKRLKESLIYHGFNGDIITFGSAATSIATFSTYYFTAVSTWAITDADAAASSTGLVSMALGDTVAEGMLLRGYVENTSWSWTVGGALYLSTIAGGITQSAPTGTLDIIRIVGYALSSNAIYWCPDNTWIEI